MFCWAVIKSRGNEVHDVASPKSQADFDGCVLPPFVYDFVGFISLPRVGRFYFISAMGNDCNAGMKFAIDVLPKLWTWMPNCWRMLSSFSNNTTHIIVGLPPLSTSLNHSYVQLLFSLPSRNIATNFNNCVSLCWVETYKSKECHQIYVYHLNDSNNDIIYIYHL